ncbi:MAG: glycosyltransferase family 2 protein [Candidatus Dormibacteraeota bacterium]|nr:glycosyltransferase family 2 protein [Candidatus Dormibacteraeota bacterium]
MGASPRIAVVIVNWNETDISLVCIHSVLRAGYPNLDVVLVDNGSDDDPTEALRVFAGKVEVVRLKTNRGYGAACNEGAMRAMARDAHYVLFLNNDTTIDAATLPELLKAARTKPPAILAPMIVYADNGSRVWSAGGYLVYPWMKNFHIGQGGLARSYSVGRRVDWATGCALLVASSTYRRLGPLDEDFFLYLEDVDWCLRAATLGIETRYVPSASVRHEVSTTVMRRLPAAHVRYYAYRNYYRLAFRYAPGWARPLIAAELTWTLAKIGIRWIFFPSFRRNAYYHARTRGLLDFLRGQWGPAPASFAPEFDGLNVGIDLQKASVRQ